LSGAGFTLPASPAEHGHDGSDATGVGGAEPVDLLEIER
jgi:hypothetical protein